MTGTCPDCGGTRTVQATRCRTCHLTQRWGPTDPDPIVVHRLINGWSVKATVAEKTEAIRALTTRGYSARLIAEMIGINERTVVRHRHHARLLERRVA